MSEIAKAAEINQSLIYHYFPSKEELWKSVKNDFVDKYVDDVVLDAKQGLKSVLTQIVTSRFELYSSHPEVVRMMAWQKLEAKKGKLAGGTPFSPDNWYLVLSELQKRGEIKADVDIDLMILFISSAVMGECQQKDGQAYLTMILDAFLQAFASPKGAR